METGKGLNKHSASKSHIQAVSVWVERQAREKSCYSADLVLSRDVVSRNRYCYLSARAVKPGPEPKRFWMVGVGWLEPEPKKHLNGGAAVGAWNLSSCLTHSFWSKPIVQIIQWFLIFDGPNRSWPGAKKRLEFGSGSKHFRRLEPEPEMWVPAHSPAFTYCWWHKISCSKRVIVHGRRRRP